MFYRKTLLSLLQSALEIIQLAIFRLTPQPAGPQAESQASDERKIHFSPSLRTCAESQSGTSALRQVYGSVVNGSCVGGWAENTSRVGDLRRGVAGWLAVEVGPAEKATLSFARSVDLIV